MGPRWWWSISPLWTCVGRACRRSVASMRVGPDGQVATVVGVVAGTGTTSPLHRPTPVVYLPFSQHYRQRMTLIVQSPLPLDAVVAGVRADLQALRPGLPIGRIARVDDIVNGDRRFARAAATVGANAAIYSQAADFRVHLP